jgi:hypothetical protein
MGSNMYAIKNVNTGNYVRKIGINETDPKTKSYTRDIEYVELFGSEQSAKLYGLCSNEIIVEIN